MELFVSNVMFLNNGVQYHVWDTIYVSKTTIESIYITSPGQLLCTLKYFLIGSILPTIAKISLLMYIAVYQLHVTLAVSSLLFLYPITLLVYCVGKDVTYMLVWWFYFTPGLFL